ncbi:ornithine carbamoyltransferase [Vulcanisaeta souniana]|uniref:Ornithine carbamoyltransferase n=1 Tax=Vulcanisaeta souniana JCM 11219 TaxID=1293586 RepID=A0A830EJM0_9CREN|nr:ornithine carbamoyltransferase [Vulcanisaeta souniana]BDR93532.1 ornithine carbamoyltransferase [Vulcanisaeta souniana JCM 11219]GGI77879.1 ornithine carbamoyltransferase [Vulcanisaeta souniana JCM 11219]
MTNIRAIRGRDFITLMDYTTEEIKYLLNLARDLKSRYYQGERHSNVLMGRTLLMIFEKPSTRTRVSLDVAATQLGMHVIYSNPQELQLGRGETIADTARVVDRFVDAIAARVYKHESLVEMARYAVAPVINALSDKEHPLQALADALTLWEIKGRLEGLRVAFVGDGDNNIAHSLMIIGAKLGWEVRIISPKIYWPTKFNELLTEDVKRTGANIMISDNTEDVRGTDAVYTDVWVSMGMETEAEERRKIFRPYQVNAELMRKAGPQAVFMHCLPAHRGEEVMDDVIDGPQSVVWDQAENRLHTAKAVLLSLLA